MNLLQLKNVFRLLALGAAIVLAPFPAKADLLLVGDFNGDSSGIKAYDATTGASQGTFVPFNSGGLTFPLGGAIGPDRNLYVSNSNNETVLRYNGTTGAFVNVFVPAVDDPAALIFRSGSLYVASSSDPGSVSRFNANTGAFVDTFVAPGSGG